MKKKVKTKEKLIKGKVKRYGLLLGGIVLAFFLFFAWKTYTNLQGKKVRERVQKSTTTSYDEEKAFKRPEFLLPLASSSAIMTPFKIPIVMYHYIEYVKDNNDIIRKRLDTTPYQFEKQLKELKENDYETYLVKDIPDIFNNNVLYNTKSVILTFDDGYEDFYTYAFPLLKKYHMRGTIYIITNNIGRIGFLNQKQIEELINSGLIEIASHTKDHTYLKTASYEIAKKQIFESKQALEKMFNIQIETFAYPVGAMSPDAIQLVKDAGYKAAVSVISGTKQSEENLFYLSRIRPGLFGNSIVRSIEAMKK